MQRSSENRRLMPAGHAQPTLRTTPIRDPDEAVQAFSTAGIDVRLERVKEPRTFSIDFDLYPFGAAELVCTNWSTDSWMKVELSGRMAIILNASGDVPSVFTTSGDEIPASTGTAPILMPDREIRVFRPTGTPLFVLSADMKDLKRLFLDGTGRDPGRLDFELALNRESAAGRRFERLVTFAVGELSADPSAIENPIFRRQLDELILGGLLLLPGQHHRLIDQSSTSIGSALVRRAEEFMEANVDRPIGMSDVASECACSRTMLYVAFKRERGWTPLQFLVRRRMERARRRLLAPFEGLTVTSVALDCGYGNFSRFSQMYRRLYGETPSKTLNRRR
jgi:AraC-like DNA-binding protein